MKTASLWRMFSIFAIATGLSLCFCSCSKDGEGSTSSKVAYTTIEYAYQLLDDELSVEKGYINLKDSMTLTVEYVDENGEKKTETLNDCQFSKKFNAKKLPCTYGFTATLTLKNGQKAEELDTLARYTFQNIRGFLGTAHKSNGDSPTIVGTIPQAPIGTRGLAGSRIAKYIGDHCQPYTAEIKVKGDGNIDTTGYIKEEE